MEQRFFEKKTSNTDVLSDPRSAYDYLNHVLFGNIDDNDGLTDGLIEDEDFKTDRKIDEALGAVMDEFTWDNDFDDWPSTSESVLVAFQNLGKELTADNVKSNDIKKLGKVLLKKVQPFLESFSKAKTCNCNYNIYCSYNEDDNGEYDGDPRYEDVDIDDLEDVVNKIKNDFFRGKLKGSTAWPPVEYDLRGSGITTAQYKKLNSDRKEDCMICTLRIECYPTKDSECEEEYVVELYGDGTISRNDFDYGDYEDDEF